MEGLRGVGEGRGRKTGGRGGEEEGEEGGWMGEGGRGRTVTCQFCKTPCQTLHRYHRQLGKHFHALSVAVRECFAPPSPHQPLPLIAPSSHITSST